MWAMEAKRLAKVNPRVPFWLLMHYMHQQPSTDDLMHFIACRRQHLAAKTAADLTLLIMHPT